MNEKSENTLLKIPSGFSFLGSKFGGTFTVFGVLFEDSTIAKTTTRELIERTENVGFTCQFLSRFPVMDSWCIFLGVLILVVILCLLRKDSEGYLEPIFPDMSNYMKGYWPRTNGQLGETLFSGWPVQASPMV